MSSAALQAAPHQPTSVSSHSPVAATSSNRPYTAEQQYYNQNPNASPSSNRRPNRRPSGNGSNSNPASSQQAQYYSPSAAAAPSAPTSTSTRSQTSPIASTLAPTGYPVMAPGDLQSGRAPVVSPRTSSNRNAAHAAASAAERSSRRTGYTESTNSPRATAGDGSQDRADRQRSNGNSVQVNGADRGADDAAMAAANAAARSRRRQQPAGEAALPHRPSGSREPRTQQSSSASSQRAAAASARSPELQRENSEVLNVIKVSDPTEDLVREQERKAEAIPSSPNSQGGAPRPMGTISSEPGEDVPRSGGRSRHDHGASKREKNSKFGDYFLGATLGEGEFGKVKMGWKQEGGVQAREFVAVKLIRRDNFNSNPTRLAKVHREVQILQKITHPNIVRLHEMIETDRQIGIILEYASGGELFDYILNHRYLKDNAARRLFAQLVSGVGYLHKKGIVHRDLKLENLLLDRNRNIIITDFGFANTFNAEDELGEEIEYNLSSREYVKQMELDKINHKGQRRGDLMQTSCGSPCYAAPELVVSESLYTGRKVDVWSCGVILYAMLAGYLPFDDDPANPEGDNINLLYKYIVSTPSPSPNTLLLTPETSFVESSSQIHESEQTFSKLRDTADIAKTTVNSQEQQETPLLARSASVREPSKTQKPPAAVGDLSRKHGNVDQDAAESHPKPQKDNKRRTVQVEYVAPRTQTQRGEPSTTTAPSGSSRTRARAGSGGPVEVQQPATRRAVSTEKPLPLDPPVGRDAQYSTQGGPPSTSQRQQGMPPPARPGRGPPRSVSDHTQLSQLAGPPVSMARPNTGGSMTSTGSRSAAMTLPTRNSYSQPIAPTVAGTNAQGRMSQPKNGKNYNISGPMMQDGEEVGRPSTQAAPKFARVAGRDSPSGEPKGHKRSSTIGGLFSRTNSIFGGKSGRKEGDIESRGHAEKPKKSYPPVSMNSSGIGHGPADTPRQSMDSRRSISFGFNKKRSGSISGSQTTLADKPRRFSFLPAGISLKAIGIGKDAPSDQYDQPPDSRGNYLEPASTSGSRNISGPTSNVDGSYDQNRDSPVQDRRGTSTSTASPSQHQRYASHGGQASDPRSGAPPQFLPPMNFRQGESTLTTESESSLNDNPHRRAGPYPAGFNDYEGESARRQTNSRGNGRGVLQKNNRKFTEAYEQDPGNGYGPTHVDHAGSSGAARKVMDFFRRRGKDRGGEK
ncbi:Fatty acyl-CoA synthetase and RNA processing-associated kinase [Lachnellula suecica]|uniref:Serine/threonine-protein kinase ATG1 n=1 Tax=Lachnellula suecica TaxID=602035 RepID=A0A8T9BWP7_9HELO|nr:Fatty acyl-CoA synthetase and RNA processing-associated kinase [Lachnellula suecica]